MQSPNAANKAVNEITMKAKKMNRVIAATINDDRENCYGNSKKMVKGIMIVVIKGDIK